MKTLDLQNSFAKRNRTLQNIAYNEIAYIKSSYDGLEVYLKDNTCHKLNNLDLDKVCQLWPSFIKIHKNYIININFITQFTSSTIFLNKKHVPLGKMFKSKLLERLNVA